MASLSEPAPTTLPDLTISGLNRFGTAVGFHLNNTGQAAAAATTAGLYLSTDSKLTTSDILLGAFSSPGLDAGGSDAENMLLSLPTNLKVGIYYVGVIADEKGQISESSETNNASAATPIVVGSTAAPIY